MARQVPYEGPYPPPPFRPPPPPPETGSVGGGEGFPSVTASAEQPEGTGDSSEDDDEEDSATGGMPEPTSLLDFITASLSDGPNPTSVSVGTLVLRGYLSLLTTRRTQKQQTTSTLTLIQKTSPPLSNLLDGLLEHQAVLVPRRLLLTLCLQQRLDRVLILMLQPRRQSSRSSSTIGKLKRP